jgi:hypothetical protein
MDVVVVDDEMHVMRCEMQRTYKCLIDYVKAMTTTTLLLRIMMITSIMLIVIMRVVMVHVILSNFVVHVNTL